MAGAASMRFVSSGKLPLSAEVASQTEGLVNCTASTLTVTELLHAGKIVTLNRAAGITATLPAATGSGARYRFFVGTTVTSNAHVIQVANANDVMAGMVHTADDTATPVPGVWVAAATSDTITLNGGSKGGVLGDYIELIDVAQNQWMVFGSLKQSGTEATPFSAAVS